jgi:hypothetical protein
VNRICAVIGKIQLRDVSGFCSENWRHSEINFILIYCTDKNIKKNFNRHVLRAVDENEGLRPDLTVFNAPHYNAPLLVDISVVQSFPGSKILLLRYPASPLISTLPSLFSIEPLIVLTTINSTNINALVTLMQFPFYPLLWSLMVSFTQLPSYFSKI